MCKKGIIITAVFDIFFEVLKKFKVRTKNNLYQLMLTVIKVFINNLLFVTKKNEFIADLTMEEHNESTLRKKILKWEFYIDDWILDNVTIFKQADIYSVQTTHD